MNLPRRDKTTPGQESVWDYPRPPRLERTNAHIVVVCNDIEIADTRQAFRVLETSHPPNYYIPPEDIVMDHLVPVPGVSWCEWKGQADYLDVVVSNARIERSAWRYRSPTSGFRAIRDHVAFYAGMMDACYVDGEQVVPQPGGFYGGWITRNITGPFKGVPGSMGW
jgi:uncharacterized protein (DUF427 family)